MTSTWKRTTRAKPCAICGHFGWCTETADGAAAHCMYTESTKACAGGGWIHRLREAEQARRYVPPTKPKPPKEVPDFGALAQRYREARTREIGEHYSESLGVSIVALDMLDTGWSNEYQALCFPMRDSSCRIVGIRLRADNGRKFAVPGSRNGLFLPARCADDPVLICEGPTDCAALLDLGFYAIGRPMNVGGGPEILTFVRDHVRPRQVVIVADRDAAGSAAERATLVAMRDLGGRLAQYIEDVRWFRPPVKDVRDWIKAGATADAVRERIDKAQCIQVTQ